MVTGVHRDDSNTHSPLCSTSNNGETIFERIVY